MTDVPQGAQNLQRLSKMVGGEQGRQLASAVDAALAAGATPDLGTRTRLASASTQRIQDLLGGYVSGGPVPVQIKKRMRKDPQIRFALAAAKAPLISAPMHFQSRSVEVKALLNEVFLESGFLRSLMDSSLNAVEFGWQNHEAMWERRPELEVQWDIPSTAGQKVEKKKYSPIYLPSTFKDLDPELVTLLWDKKGKLLGSMFGPNVRMNAMDDIKDRINKGEINYLPPEKMFLFTPIFEWQNYYGEGRLDWAYEHWYWSNLLYLVAMRWYERKSDPPLICRAPASAEVVPDPEDTGIDGANTSLTDSDARQDSLGATLRMAERLRSHGVAVLPSEPFMDENGKPSNLRAYDIEELEIRDMHPAFIDMIDHLDKKKSRAILVSDTVISRDRQQGTLGSTEAAVDVAVEIQNQTLGRFIRAFNQQVLAPFLAYNNIKEKATLVSPGVFRDNRALLKDMILKAFEADMMAEQVLGRQDPNSLIVTFDRMAAARSVGLPMKDPDPDAPVKTIPLPGKEPNAADPKGGTGVGSAPQTSQKGQAAPGKRKAGTDPKALALATKDFEDDVQRRAEGAEYSHTRAAAQTRFRQDLSDTERALAVIMLWMVLRADKKDASGKILKGSKSGDDLVWREKTILPAAELSRNFGRIDSLVSQYEGRGLSVAQAGGTNPVLAQARRGMDATLASMRGTIQGGDLQQLVAMAAAQGQAEVESILQMWDPDTTVLSLDPEEVQAIVSANSEGLLLNIDNIARRNGSLLAESALMAFAAGRQLGLIEEIAGFKFNSLHSDLTLEAHLRAAYRGTVVATARKSGIYSFIKVPQARPELAEEGLYDYYVGTDDFWKAEGEAIGAPSPHETFGFHYGSTSYWYPVPTNRRIRTPFAE